LIELVKLIEEAFGKKANFEMLDRQPGDVSVTFADITKARQRLNYQPKITMEEGIKRFVQWYKEKT